MCEKWEAKRKKKKDLFNKLGGSRGYNQMKERKDAQRGTHTDKDENQNLQIPKTENQKKTKKQQTERKALVQKDFDVLIQDQLTAHLMSSQSSFSSSVPDLIFFYYFILIAEV